MGEGGGVGREGGWKGGRGARGEGEDEGARMPRNGLLYLCLLTLAWFRQQLGFGHDTPKIWHSCKCVT